MAGEYKIAVPVCFHYIMTTPFKGRSPRSITPLALESAKTMPLCSAAADKVTARATKENTDFNIAYYEIMNYKVNHLHINIPNLIVHLSRIIPEILLWGHKIFISDSR